MEFEKSTSCILKYAMRPLIWALNHIIWFNIEKVTRLTSGGHEVDPMHDHASQNARAYAQKIAMFVHNFQQPYLIHFSSIFSEPKLILILIPRAIDRPLKVKICTSH